MKLAGIAIGLILLVFSRASSSNGLSGQDACPISSHVANKSLIVDASMCKASVAVFLKKLGPQLDASLDNMDAFALLPPTGPDNERDIQRAWQKTCRAVGDDLSRVSGQSFLKNYQDSELVRSVSAILARHGFPRISLDDFYPRRGSSRDVCDGTLPPPAIWFARPIAR